MDPFITQRQIGNEKQSPFINKNFLREFRHLRGPPLFRQPGNLQFHVITSWLLKNMSDLLLGTKLSVPEFPQITPHTRSGGKRGYVRSENNILSHFHAAVRLDHGLKNFLFLFHLLSHHSW